MSIEQKRNYKIFKVVNYSHRILNIKKIKRKNNFENVSVKLTKGKVWQIKET